MLPLLVLLASTLSPAVDAAPKWAIVIHGGAGVIERKELTAEQEAAYREALTRAIGAGSDVLGKGGTALDAVEATIVLMEDDPLFNAGRGAVFTAEGRNELDASIMDGRTRAAGAVTGVTRTKNPIGLARAVMEKSEHVFLSREGADEFSRQQGLAQVERDYFETPERRRQLDEFKSKKVSALDIEYKFGTVGAVALDSSGHVAAATSTGGMTGKRWGRIGDSPIIGAGTYADDRGCAVSGTGWGEYFIRVGVAHEICARMRLDGTAPQQAADEVMAEVKSLGGDGGVILVTPKGDMVYSFNTAGMYRGKADAGGRSTALYSNAEER